MLLERGAGTTIIVLRCGDLEMSLMRFKIWKCVCVFMCVCHFPGSLRGSEMFSMDNGAGRRGGCSFITQHLLCGTLLMSGHLCVHHHGAAPVSEQEPEDVSQENLGTLLVKVLKKMYLPYRNTHKIITEVISGIKDGVVI